MTEIRYRCAICQSEAVSTPEEEEQARRELQEQYGDVSLDDCVVVCDACYTAKLMGLTPPIQDPKP